MFLFKFWLLVYAFEIILNGFLVIVIL